MNADLNRISEVIIGCAYRVASELGCGFLESVYEKALAIELDEASLAFERQERLEVCYRGQCVGEFAVDFLVEHSIIVELKAARSLMPEDQAQLLNYLNAAQLSLGLLINFGTPKVQVKRMVRQFRE